MLANTIDVHVLLNLLLYEAHLTSDCMADIEIVVAKMYFTVQLYYNPLNDDGFDPSVILFFFCRKNIVIMKDIRFRPLRHRRGLVYTL